MRDIGKNMKQLRIQKNITQDDLAQALFVTRQTVSNYETGRSRPDVDMLIRIAQALDTDTNTLIYGVPVPESKRKQYWSMGISIGLTAVVGILYLWLQRIGIRVNTQYTQLSMMYLLNIWVLPVWRLMVGWTGIHILCLTCGTKTLHRKASASIKWSILGIIAAYIVLVTPHSIWFLWCDWQTWKLQQGGGDWSFTASFSVFPAWDWLVMHVTTSGKPRTGWQMFFAVLDYLPIVLGLLLRLCGFPLRTQKKPTETED